MTLAARQDIRPIHTVNARGNILLEVVRDHSRLSPADMLREIQGLRRETEEVLRQKGIRYEALRSALVPSQDRREIALIFDSTKISDGNYGREVFSQFMPLFDANGNNSVLAGDYGSINRDNEALCAKIFVDTVVPVRPVTYRHSSNFYVVYINNLTDAMAINFDSGLRSFVGYVGMVDVSYGSPFKFLLSTMLANAFLKHGRVIIQGHEDDRPNSEDVNLIGWPFEKYGYTVRSLASYLQGPLLTYKIERPVLQENDADTELSINSVSASPLPLDDFTIEIDEAKAGYIRTKNASAIGQAGLANADADKFRQIIAAKIKASYIYGLEYIAAYDVTKFNLIVELPATDAKKSVRFLAGLEYKPDKKTLRVITLF
jgi:hypothetical protein